MPGPYLNTTRTIRTAEVVAGFVALLGADPGLSEIAVRVIPQDGSRRNLPEFDPEEAQLPAIKVLNPLVSGGWLDESGHLLTMTIPVELYFLGSHFRDHATILELYCRAVRPALDDPTYTNVNADWIEANGIENVSLSRPSAETVRRGSDQFATRIRADVEVTYRIET